MNLVEDEDDDDVRRIRRRRMQIWMKILQRVGINLLIHLQSCACHAWQNGRRGFGTGTNILV